MSIAKEGITDGESSIATANAARWPTAVKVRRRARRDLRPIEVALMTRYRPELSGNVLEVASRGDALTDVLIHHAANFSGIGSSTPEVQLCRTRYPNAQFLQRNLIDLDEFEDGQFDAVVAGRYAIDHLAHDQRRLLLGRLSRIVADDGVLIFSSHNLARESLVHAPLRHALAHPWQIFRLASAIRNRALLGSLQERSYGYALLNDGADGYSQLSYYVSCATQKHQLHENDFSLVECVDRNDEPVTSSCHAYHERELYFIARPGTETWVRRLAGGELI